jgi:hypothetical protein
MVHTARCVATTNDNGLCFASTNLSSRRNVELEAANVGQERAQSRQQRANATEPRILGQVPILCVEYPTRVTNQRFCFVYTTLSGARPLRS